jgi:cytochrome bd ubiquinol oxidase subunit I
MDALALHRLHFAFTITYHYLFPQLTMGLGLYIVIFKVLQVRRGDEVAGDVARFLSRIFGLNFAMGVVTGLPMEFQFGAGWSRFSEAAGGVIGQTLAMEGVFAFFLESSFLYLLLFGEKRLSPRAHLGAAVLVFLGSWLSGWFIIVTNAWMQHPVGHQVQPDGTVILTSLTEYLTNPWAFWQYLHTMLGSVVTASFVVASVGAFYLLSGRHEAHAKKLLSVAVPVGLAASVLIAFPAGDAQAKMVAARQPVTFAAMEGHFHTEDGAGLVVIGQPNMETLTLDNPIVLPRFLSFMTHQRWDTRIEGLTSFDRSRWPDNIPLLYFAYHMMVGLGTMFIALMGLSALQLLRKRLFQTRVLLWGLMLALPFPYIANTAGWLTAELGRQPWLIYDVMRTRDGYTLEVSSGNVLFTLLGYMGLYAVLSLIFFALALRILRAGPATAATKANAPAGGEA